jgi:hypothetical protein
MIRSPACIDALEARICTNITSGREPIGSHMQWFIEAKGFSHPGHGLTAEMAVHNFLVRNGLESRDAPRPSWRFENESDDTGGL